MRRYPETYPPRNFYVVESGVVLTPSEQRHLSAPTYALRTSAGVLNVEDDGARWRPGDGIPEGAQPNAARASAVTPCTRKRPARKGGGRREGTC